MVLIMHNLVSFTTILLRLCVFYTCFLFFSRVHVLARDCVGRDQCSCVFDDDKSLIAINSLGNTDLTPRFKDVSSNDGSTYSYNPCYPFSEGDDTCTNAAACETSLGSIIGEAQTAQFQYSGSDVVVGYSAGHGILTLTQVTLKCDPHACTPSIVAEGSQGLNLYTFTLTTVCACPNGCTEDGPVNCSSKSPGGIGGGAVVLIIFFSFAFIYMVGGTLFLAFGRKARGREMIPNVNFWTSLPGLIKDGVLFSLRPCLRKRYGYSST